MAQLAPAHSPIPDTPRRRSRFERGPPDRWASASVASPETTRSLIFTLGQHELVIRRRYQALSIINDILIGLWFLIGSVMFFSDAWTYTGTWLFVIGSIELLIRPAIRLTRQIHLQRLPGRRDAPIRESEHDY